MSKKAFKEPRSPSVCCCQSSSDGRAALRTREVLPGRNKWVPLWSKSSVGEQDPLINGDYCVSVDGRYLYAVCYSDPEMEGHDPVPGLYVCDIWFARPLGVYQVIYGGRQMDVLGFTEYAKGQALLMTKRQDGQQGFEIWSVTLHHNAEEPFKLQNFRLFKVFDEQAGEAIVTWWGPEVFFLFMKSDRRTELHKLDPVRGIETYTVVQMPTGVVVSDDCLFTYNSKIYLFEKKWCNVDRKERRSGRLVEINFANNAYSIRLVEMIPTDNNEFPNRIGDICIETRGKLIAFKTVTKRNGQGQVVAETDRNKPDASSWALDLETFQWRKISLEFTFRDQPIVWLACSPEGKGLLLRQGYGSGVGSDEIQTCVHSFWTDVPRLQTLAIDSAFSLYRLRRLSAKQLISLGFPRDLLL